MPILKLSDKYSLELLCDIKEKKILPDEFLSRQCELIELNNNQRNLDWRSSVSTGSGRPRYVILGFQKARFLNDHENSSEFDNLDIRNACIELNGERYPDHNLELNFTQNRFATGHQMMVDFYKKVMGMECCTISFENYKNIYPLLVFDISRQIEKLKDNGYDVRIKADFNTNIPENTIADALILSDRDIQLQSDGNRMHILS